MNDSLPQHLSLLGSLSPDPTEAAICGPPDVKSQLTEKDPDAGKN